VWGAFVGALIIGIVANLFNLLGVHPEWQQVAKGLIILLAVGLQTLNNRLGTLWTLTRPATLRAGEAP
jgi:ribose/xylose/arabinose/galactoside ABC-type transport system permease subunit